MAKDNYYAPGTDSDQSGQISTQPRHPPNLIRVFAMCAIDI